MTDRLDPLDSYIVAAAQALGIPLREEWGPAVRTNLDVTLKLASSVDEFPLPDDAEPASVFRA